MTYLWALFEVGLALATNAARWLVHVLGLWFLLPRVRRGLLQREPDALLKLPASRTVTAALAIWSLPCSPPIAGMRLMSQLQRAPDTPSMTLANGDIMGQASVAHVLPLPRRLTPPMSDSWNLHGQSEQAYPESSKAHRFKSMMDSICVPVETSSWRSTRTAARSAGDMIQKSSLRESGSGTHAVG